MGAERVEFNRRQMCATALVVGSGAFGASGEVLASGNEGFLSQKENFGYQSAELARQHSRDALFYALDTGNAEYLALVCANSFNWTGYRDGSWAYSPLDDKQAVALFESGMTVGRTQSLKWQETSGGARVLVKDLTLPRGAYPSQVAFVELEVLGEQYVISRIEEVPQRLYINEFLRQFQDEDVWKDCKSNGYWVRLFHLRRKGVLLTDPEAVIRTDLVKHVVCVPGLISEILGVGGGDEESGIFIKILTEVRAKKDGPEDSVIGANGLRVDSRGVVHSEGNLCTETLSDPRDRAHVMYDFILTWFAVNPNGILRFVTHSEGCHPLILALMRLKGDIENIPEFPIKPRQINVFFTHAPVLGVEKPILRNVARFITGEVGGDCKVLGSVPEIGVLSHPTVKYMFWRWENRKTWAKEIEEAVSWYIKNGADWRSGGNYQDQVISLRWGSQNDWVWLGILRAGAVPEIVRTQMVPGIPAKYLHMGLFGNKSWGHDRFLKDERGLLHLLDFALS